MTEALPDTWHNRDLPVLREVVRLVDESMGPVDIGTVRQALELSDEDVTRAILALDRGGLLRAAWQERASGAKQLHFVRDVSAEAYERTGAWPTPDTGADRLIAALENLAETAPTEDERTRARKMLDAVTGAGRDIAVSVATAVITGAVQ